MTGALAGLVADILDVQPLASGLPQPVRVHGPADETASRLLAGLGEQLPALDLRVAPAATPLSIFESVISRRLRLDTVLADPATAAALPDLDLIFDDAVADTFDRYRMVTVTRPGAPAVRAYVGGNPADPAVIIAGACGMPARLLDQWFDALTADHFVLTWETRGLFLDSTPAEFDTQSCSVSAQASDLLAVLDAFGVEQAHVLGICGGASIALTATGLAPQRVGSLSLWHADLELGPGSMKTLHQRNLLALMEAVTESRAMAASVHAVFCQSVLDSAPPDLAHLVLYPYATDELMYRYSKLNSEIMHTDVSRYLSGITTPTLVVTSESDETAHPGNSKLLADRLSHADLRLLPLSNHMLLFTGSSRAHGLALEWIRAATFGGDHGTADS